MKISIITLFPEVFETYLNTSILGRAKKKGKVEFEFINLRDFGEGKHQVVDGRPYGGGPGMVLRADILAKALKKAIGSRQQATVILTSASGKPYKQSDARRLSKAKHLILVCGHYEGVDQRFIDKYVDEEVSIGDFVLTGGELPTMVIIDSIVRLIPGVLEKPEAVENESYSRYTINDKPYTLLEGPQYTRPDEFEGEPVPEILKSGHHAEVEKWHKAQSLKKTKKVRSDLIQKD